MLKAYVYAGCDRCRRAMTFLRRHDISFEEFAIRDNPPTLPELKEMLLARGSIRRLFNTSGTDYKTLRLSERLFKISEAEALGLLARNGNLVKRPFLTGEGVNLTGFDEAEWEAALSRSR